MVMPTKTPQGARLNPQNTLELSQGMSIQVAIDTANAHGGEWTILLYPYAYREGDITHVGAANITIKGMGLDRVAIAPTVAPAAGVIISGAELTLENLEVMNPGILQPALRVTGGTCNCHHCSFDQVGGVGGNVIEVVINTLNLYDCETDVGAIDLRDAGCTLDIEASRIRGPIVTAGAFAHNVTIRHCDCNNQAFNLGATGACHYDFESNNEMGAITDASLGAGAVNGEICRCHVGGAFVKNGTTGWLIDNSELAAITSTNATGVISVYGGIVLTVTSSAGIIRLISAFYRTIVRTATGNIIDQSPWLGDQPWHVEKWSWQAALANSQVTTRGAPLDAGSGQVLLQVIDTAASSQAVETLGEVAGTLGNQFYGARTPRFITQISVNTDGAGGGGTGFDPVVDMFYGLRGTLANAIPGAAENHAGFIWNGTQWLASSSNGAGAGETTDLTGSIPADDAQHQLEVLVFGGVYVEFYVDGVLAATHLTAAGQPTVGVALDWQHLLVSAAGGGGDTITVTVRNGGCQECPS